MTSEPTAPIPLWKRPIFYIPAGLLGILVLAGIFGSEAGSAGATSTNAVSTPVPGSATTTTTEVTTTSPPTSTSVATTTPPPFEHYDQTARDDHNETPDHHHYDEGDHYDRPLSELPLVLPGLLHPSSST